MGNPLAGVDADVWMAATPSISTTNEACTDTGDHTTYLTSVHDAWDWTTPVVVQCSANGSSGWATATDYVFQYAGGVIVFNTARNVGSNAFVRVSTGYYFNLTQLDDAHTWTLSAKADIKETTPFQAAGAWARNTATIKKGTAKVDTVRSDGRISIEIGNTVGMQLFIDKSANVRWDLLGIISSVDIKSDVKDVDTQSMTVDLYGGYYLRTT